MAYVGDFSYFGLTSPVDGGRHRFEVEGNFGDLNFVNLLADYRRYFFVKPVTLAFRTMYYGRYGTDSENPRLTPLFLGNEALVRGYAVNSFGGRQCSSDNQGGACSEFDRLLGSKIALGNVEFRLPLLGTERFGLMETSFLPTELALFIDGGLAWTDEESPDLTLSTDDTGRIPVFSAGASLRFNVMGRLVAEVYWARAFQRTKNNHLGFQISPGW